MSDKMKIVERKISELKPLPYNPRIMTIKQYEDLKVSLKKFGCVDPIIVNKHQDGMDNIVGGHQRVKVWAELGHETIPTVEVYLDPEQEREICLRLNRNVGSWDWDMLSNEFDDTQLLNWGFVPEDFGVQEETQSERNQKEDKEDQTVCPCCKRPMGED